MTACMFDKATEQEELTLKYALLNQLSKGSKRQVTPKGCCYNCNETLVGQATFCDEDCRDDYEYQLKRKSANAKVK